MKSRSIVPLYESNCCSRVSRVTCSIVLSSAKSCLFAFARRLLRDSVSICTVVSSSGVTANPDRPVRGPMTVLMTSATNFSRNSIRRDASCRASIRSIMMLATVPTAHPRRIPNAATWYVLHWRSIVSVLCSLQAFSTIEPANTWMRVDVGTSMFLSPRAPMSCRIS